MIKARNIKGVMTTFRFKPLYIGLLCLISIACSDGRAPGDPNGGGSSSGGNSSGGSSGGSSGSLACQQNCVLITEAMSSNASFRDWDGDSPDWFEIFNDGSQTVSLQNWSVTDDPAEPQKWSFPEYSLEPGEYFRIWASDKDRISLGEYRTLVNEGDEFSYLLPSSEVDSSWTTLSFDDASWLRGNSGLGYGDGDDNTELAAGTTAVFARRIFQISEASGISELWLDIDFDDAFVAYLNGVEIARSNILGAQPGFDAVPLTDIEASMYQSGSPLRFDLVEHLGLLQNGNNVLSIQVHNVSSESTDLSLIPFLSAFYSSGSSEGVEPPAILALQNQGFHSNFKISSEGETLFLYRPDGSLAHSLAVESLRAEHSIGRSVNSGEIVYYQSPTPGAANLSTEFLGIIDTELVFSHQGGFNSPASVTLSGAASDENIRYTLDATEPNWSSALYNGAIAVNNNTVIRAAAFKADYIPSRIATRSYLPGVSHDLPIVSLVTDPENFFDQDTGIYVYGDDFEDEPPYFGANFWQDWERDIHFSFYEIDGSLGTALDGGVKIFGGWSRAHDQRSLSIFARNRYGVGEIDYPVLPALPYQNFKSIVLRNSGNDWLSTMLRDATLTSLMDDSGLDIQAFRPVVSYINGEYWGLYNIREKINEDYLASKYGVDPDTVDILERQGEIIEGSNTDYEVLINFVENNSLIDPGNYDLVAQEIDIDNFILYQVAQIYFNNQDWPGNNIKFWRAPGGKWRWILFDTDFGFGIWNVQDYFIDTLAFALEENGLVWPNPPWSTLLFRRLMENEDFQNKVINRFADELNTRFLPTRVNNHIDTLADDIASEIPAHYTRWNGTVGEVWSGNVNNMKIFASNRPEQVRNHVQNHFGLTGSYSLEIINSNPSRGSVVLNNLTINESNWNGLYYDEVPITLTAQAAEGFVFSHWQGDSSAITAEITLSPNGNTSVEAVFTAVQ